MDPYNHRIRRLWRNAVSWYGHTKQAQLHSENWRYFFNDDILQEQAIFGICDQALNTLWRRIICDLYTADRCRRLRSAKTQFP